MAASHNITYQELKALGFEGAPSDNEFWLRPGKEFGDHKATVYAVTGGCLLIGADDWNMCDAPGVKTAEDLKQLIKLLGYER